MTLSTLLSTLPQADIRHTFLSPSVLPKKVLNEGPNRPTVNEPVEEKPESRNEYWARRGPLGVS